MKTAIAPVTPEAVQASLTAAGLVEDRDLTGIECQGYSFGGHTGVDIPGALMDFQAHTGFPANIFRVWAMSFVLGHRFADVELAPAEPARVAAPHCESCTCVAEQA